MEDLKLRNNLLPNSVTFSGDMSAKRHIISFGIHGETFIRDGWEYIELRVKGQSFMIHQIRKMIGLIIARSSGHCGDDHVGKRGSIYK